MTTDVTPAAQSGQDPTDQAIQAALHAAERIEHHRDEMKRCREARLDAIRAACSVAPRTVVARRLGIGVGRLSAMIGPKNPANPPEESSC